MIELVAYKERCEWMPDKTRIGFYCDNSIENFIPDIWTIELYKKAIVDRNEYYLFITTNADESWIVLKLEGAAG